MIDRFMGETRWLSNFHESPIEYDGYRFLNAEAAYQSQKLLQPELRNVFTTLDGKSAKRLGRQIEIRPHWDQIKLGVMSEVTHCKFTQDEELRGKLLATGDEVLIEGNTWGDQFWGVCSGKGENWLGRILMAERRYWQVLNRT